SRSTAGGPAGDEDSNWTVYKFRYLNRTHHAFYWTRIDGLAAEALAQTGEPVAVADAVLSPGEPLVVDVTDANVASPAVDFGDGARTEGAHAEHGYAAPGVYELVVRGTRAGAAFAF